MSTLGKTTTPTTPTFGWIEESSHLQVAMPLGVTQSGLFQSVSFWAAGSSTLVIHGVIWDANGNVLAFGPGVSTSGGSGSGVGATQWYTDTFATPVFIATSSPSPIIYIGWQADTSGTVAWAYNGNDHAPNTDWNIHSGSTGKSFAGYATQSPSGAVAAYATYTPASMYIRRGGVWVTATESATRRSGAWSATSEDAARRSGVWVPGS